jgi:CRP-like cAMP-binding protein
MLLDDAADAAPVSHHSAKRHPLLLEEPGAEPPAPQPGAKRHPALLEEPGPAPAKRPAGPGTKAEPGGRAAPPRPAGPAQAPPRPPGASLGAPPVPPVPPRPPGPAAPAPPPKAAPPPIPRAGAAVKVGPPPPLPAARLAPPVIARARPVTLDRLSLPPAFARQGPAGASERAAAEQSPREGSALQISAPLPEIDVDVADIYSQALDGIEELSVDPNAPSNQTRFSDAPPRPAALRLSDVEIEPRRSVSELPVHEPPPAATLAKLPLFPLFAEVPKEALAQMIAGSELIELEDGSLVMRKGDPGDALYGIIEGSVEIAVPGQQSRLLLAEGDVFGESCLLQDELCHADAVVQGSLTVLRVPRDVLVEMLQIHPPLAELLLELLTRRLLGNLLQTSLLFQEFDAAGRRELSQLFEIRRAPADTMLAVLGKRMDGLYISLTGTLAINQPGAPERIAPPGSMFGQNTLLTHQPSQVDVKTRVNMIVLRLPAAQFTRVAMQYPTILARLAELSTSEVVRVTM